MERKKYCAGCAEVKPRSEFSPKRKAEPNGQVQSLCKLCNSLKRREYPMRVYKRVNGCYVWTGSYR
jgi:hypothetical protein